MPSSAALQVRRTQAEIDLGAIAHNLALLREAVGARTQVYGVVKADAYGHGLIPVAQRLVGEGIEGLCVALVEEGLALRRAGLTCPVLVLNGLYGDAHGDVLRAGLTPVVYDSRDLVRFRDAAGNAEVRIHLKVDTGMTRLGVRPEGLASFLDQVERASVTVEGLMTHLSSAEDGPETTEAQLGSFEDAAKRVRARGHRPILHAANSAGAWLRPRARGELVRAGVALYGVRPTADSVLDLRPAMRLVTSVARVADVPAGTAVGYGRTWVASQPSRIATLAIGYGDGLMRHLSNRGAALIGGRRCPIVGRVSMDLTSVDVTGLTACERGDEAILIGTQGEAVIRAEEVAAAAGTIAYEVLSNISPRVPRIQVEAP